MKTICKLFYSVVHFFFSKYDEECANRRSTDNVAMKVVHIVKQGFFFVVAIMPTIAIYIGLTALLVKIGIPVYEANYFACKIAGLISAAMYFYGANCKAFGY